MKARFFILICLTLWLMGCGPPAHPRPFAEVPALKNEANTSNSIRFTALQETAMSIGAQGGLSWRSHQLNQIVLAQQDYLSQIFNFNALILSHNVLPPVLVEGNSPLNLADPSTIRLADKVYRIVLPPRFVTAPPNWREYLWLNYPPPAPPNAVLLPKNAEEQEIWNRYVKVGWNDGIEQADNIFSANLGRLKRDYAGMILYKKLLDQNIVTPPYVGRLALGITGGGKTLRINDQVLRITATSELNPNSKTWRAVVTKGEAGGANEDEDEALPPSP